LPSSASPSTAIDDFMPKRKPAPKPSNRKLSLGTLLIVILLVVVIYNRTGTLPDAVLETVLGEDAATVHILLDATDTPAVGDQEAVLTSQPLPASSEFAVAEVTSTSAVRLPTVTLTPQQTRGPTASPALAQSGLPTIAYTSLPAQAHETIRLIDQDGPFPYSKDGSIFQNRERLLPLRDRNYYREYTVETPGSRDRGARRIVAGNEGELYYTDDHYSSFKEILR
jgi:ribonuclease T1